MNITKSYIDSIYHNVPRDFESAVDNNSVCGYLYRTGTLCGQCIDGYYPAVYSYSFDCVPCNDENLKSNWGIYVATAYLPLTVFIIFLFISSQCGLAKAERCYIPHPNFCFPSQCSHFPHGYKTLPSSQYHCKNNRDCIRYMGIGLLPCLSARKYMSEHQHTGSTSSGLPDSCLSHAADGHCILTS